MRDRTLAAAACACAALALGARTARAFCRTSTCPLPASFSPSPAGCQPIGFEQYCAGLSTPVVPRPLWWRNACESYDIQQDASAQVPYDFAANAFAAAFGKWTGASCGDAGSPSVAVKDLGPVACDQVNYNDNTSGMGNQHVIIFRDPVWPYPGDLNNTLGLTTITFDPDTGEIYDADMEINSTVPLTLSDPVAPGGYDFMSIITHESGHFFGMAHSNETNATMYAQYVLGSTTKRTLSPDDVAGICSIYPPGGVRTVDPAVATGGLLAEDPCDPTPRHGFQSACFDPSGGRSGSGAGGGGCSLAPAPIRASRSTGLFAILVAAIGAAVLRRRGGRAEP